jgi:hypothetical protein
VEAPVHAGECEDGWGEEVREGAQKG